MQNRIIINLPKEIAVLKEREVIDIAPRAEEFSIYYENIIYPYSDMYDVVIDCEYGANLGHCWRISNTREINETEFDLTLKVYGPFGKLLAQRKTKILLISHNEKKKEMSVLCIGDSMTNAETYVAQAANKARNIKTLGTRSTFSHAFHEGRGGWTVKMYFENWFSEFSVSPFLFPKNIDGEKYYGQLSYMKKTINATDEYRYRGYNYKQIEDGMFYLGDDKKLYLYQNGEGVLYDKAPEFEFDFDKYLKRFDIQRPDIVSILFGGNELQLSGYEEAPKAIDDFLYNLKRLVEKVSHKDTKIIINLPIGGAEQYAWGTKVGCSATYKQYMYKVLIATEKILSEFDGRENENIYICPMGAAIDLKYGFDFSYYRANAYSTAQVMHHNNWVHPAASGYMQMGDALAAVINKIRDK